MIEEKNLSPSLRRKIGAGMYGAEERYVYSSGTGAPYSWLNGRGPGEGGVDESHLHPSITTALAAATTGRNDIVNLTPENHSQAVGITWDKNMTHLLGNYPKARQNMRSRIGQSAAMANLLTVSGYGNLFENLYFMHGTGGAVNLNCLTDTGGRNTYRNCHLLPADAVALDQAAYDLVRLGSNEIYFEECTFGTDAIAWTNGNMIEFQASVDPPRSFFKNCTFYMNADNAQVTFMKVIAGAGGGIAFFENCKFINIGTTLTLGIDGTGLGNFKMIFDLQCTFWGCTDVVAAANEASVIWGFNYAGAAAVDNLLATSYDHTA